MTLEAGMISVPGAPNWEDGVVSIEDFHGIQLLAFGTGRQLVILRKDSMAAVFVSHELSGHIRAVCWGGKDVTIDETVAVDRNSSANVKQLHDEPDSVRTGTIAVSMDFNVMVLVALHEPYNRDNPALIPWSWTPVYNLQCCAVTQLAWCPLSNILITCSQSSVCGWKISIPQDQNCKRSSGKENSRHITNLSNPVWETERLPSFSNFETESTPVSKLSFTCDGVSHSLSTLECCSTSAGN